MVSSHRSIIRAATLSLLACAAVTAGTYTWNGGSAVSANWTDPANWVSGNSPFQSDPNASLVLDGTTRTTNTLDQNLGSNSLTFASTAGAFAVSGTGVLTLGSGGITNNSSNAQTINAPLVLSSAQTWTNNGGLLTIGGTIDNTAGLAFAGNGSKTISGVISDSGGLNLQSGTLTLTGNNTYTGGTAVTGPTALYVGNGGTTGSITGDAVLTVGGLVFKRSDSITYSGVLSGTGFVDQLGSGTLTLTGATNSSTLQLFAAAGTTNIGASMKWSALNDTGATVNVSGSGVALTLDSAGNGLLAEANPSNGVVNVTAGGAIVTPNVTLYNGTLNVGGANSTVNVAGGVTGSDATVNAVNISGGGSLTAGSLAGPLNLGFDNGTLALTQTGSNSSSLTLNSGGGTLSVASGQTATFTGGIGGSGALFKTGSGTLVLTGANTSTGTTTITSGTLQIGNGGTGASPSGDIVNNGALVFNSSNNLTYGGAISGTGGLTVQKGQVTLTGNNTYTGGTTISGPTLIYVGNGGTTGSITGDVAANVGGLVFKRSDSITYGGVLSGTGFVDQLGTGSLTLTGATNSSTLQLFTASGTTNIDASMKFSALNNTGGTVNVSGPGVTLTLDSAGSGLLAETSTTSGVVNVSNGGEVVTPTVTLYNGALNVVGANSAVTVTGGVTGATGTVNSVQVSGGGSLTTASLGGPVSVTLDNGTLGLTQTGSTSSSFMLNSGGGTVDVATGQTVTFTAGVGGSGSLTKTGAGTLNLNGADSYTGNTYVDSGKLMLSAPLPDDDSSHVYVAGGKDSLFFDAAEFAIGDLLDASYAGLGTTEIGGDESAADILFGTSPVSTQTSVDMKWTAGSAVSDILDLSGMGVDGGSSGQTDLFVLQMSYNATGMSLAEQQSLFLTYYNGSDWVNAILGNFGQNAGSQFQGGWTNDAAHDTLGAFGVDTTNHVVWAVIDHNSEFAVSTPEPGTWLLFCGAGLAALVMRRLRIVWRG